MGGRENTEEPKKRVVKQENCGVKKRRAENVTIAFYFGHRI